MTSTRCTRRSRSLLTVFAAAALGTLAMLPADAEAQNQVPRVRLFHSDSAEVTEPVLSPDGRWLVFSRAEAANRASLWLQPAAGGEAHRLTGGGHFDDQPRWLSTGDRIVFRSNRPARAGDGSSYVMVLPLNAATGQPAGPPRQVSAEPVGFELAPSPDGEWVAYQDGLDQTKLMVVPAVGGAAREVTKLPGVVHRIGWTPDGRALHLATRYPAVRGQHVYRVPAGGGEATRVLTLLDKGGLVFSADGRHAAVSVNGPSQRERTIEVVTLEGDIVKRIPANTNTRPIGFTRDGRGLIALESNTFAPTRLVSISGGRPRELTPGNSYDWVLGFSRDGSAVYTWTENDAGTVLARVPLNGGARQDRPRSRTEGWEAVSSRYLFQLQQPEGASTHRLTAVSLEDDSRHPITDALVVRGPMVAGPGGAWATGEEIFFLQQSGTGVEVHGWTAPGRKRLIRAFPAGRPRALAVHGSQTAWEQQRGDSVDIMIADGPAGTPRRLLTTGLIGNGNELAFSHDGRMLAVHATGADRRQDLMAILDVTGRAAPRMIDSGMSYWYWPRWLPDNSAIAVIGGGVGAESHVLLVPLAAGAKPVNITKDDPSPKWGFELSPDGRWVAYPGEVWKGSTVWKIDLR